MTGHFSPDKKHWWDGSDWRPVSDDGKWWWDGTQWNPAHEAAINVMPSAADIAARDVTLADGGTDLAAGGEATAVSNASNESTPVGDEAPEVGPDLVLGGEAPEDLNTSSETTSVSTNEVELEQEVALADQGLKAMDPAGELSKNSGEDVDAEIEPNPSGGYRVNPMGLIVSPAGEWWWATRWSELIKKPAEPKPKEKGPKLGFGQVMQMATLAQEMKRAIADKGSVAAVEAELQTRADARKGLFAAVQASCPLKLEPGMPRLPGAIELFPDEFLATTAKDWGLSSQRLTITTHRIIYTRGRVSKAAESMYLQDVRDVKYLQPVFSLPKIALETASGISSLEGLPAMSPSKAQKVRNDILAMVHFARQRAQAPPATNQPATGPEDIPGKLKQLAELHAMGILTNEEFQEKKADLLKRL